uniref:Major facilitator superfamily (MFS) profile domain-containing protein n=1 Tax=Bionectria ochroleuca TaxID=29856 RepID=A0A8H7KF15_BIOOC
MEATSALYVGSIVAGLTYPFVMARVSRRAAMFWAAFGTIFFVALQGASQNIAMFIAARIGMGYGKACFTMAAPTYLAETFPYKSRGWALGLISDFYYVGALVAAGITYRTAKMDNTWSWRIPSIIQGFWSLLCLSTLPFIPESPRWLVYHNRHEEALRVLAQINSDRDIDDPIVRVQHKEIVDTLEYKKSDAGRLNWKQILKSPSARKRLSLVICCALGTIIIGECSICKDSHFVLRGSMIATYYFGDMLTNAGITDSDTQLQLNVILNAWCLACAMVGTLFSERIGRRPNAIWFNLTLTTFLYIVGALTKFYGTSDNKSGVYATVGFIFLFKGAYSFGWTPLAYLYPPEILNYQIRTFGMGLNTFTIFGSGIIFVFMTPFMLEALGWKTYIMNASWNFALLAFIWFFWVETKGKTLEEIDEIIEGVKYSDAPNVQLVEQGKVDLEISELFPARAPAHGGSQETPQEHGLNPNRA